MMDRAQPQTETAHTARAAPRRATALPQPRRATALAVLAVRTVRPEQTARPEPHTEMVPAPCTAALRAAAAVKPVVRVEAPAAKAAGSLAATPDETAATAWTSPAAVAAAPDAAAAAPPSSTAAAGGPAACRPDRLHPATWPEHTVIGDAVLMRWALTAQKWDGERSGSRVRCWAAKTQPANLGNGTARACP